MPWLGYSPPGPWSPDINASAAFGTPGSGFVWSQNPTGSFMGIPTETFGGMLTPGQMLNAQAAMQQALMSYGLGQQRLGLEGRGLDLQERIARAQTMLDQQRLLFNQVLGPAGVAGSLLGSVIAPYHMQVMQMPTGQQTAAARRYF